MDILNVDDFLYGAPKGAGKGGKQGPPSAPAAGMKGGSKGGAPSGGKGAAPDPSKGIGKGGSGLPPSLPSGKGAGKESHLPSAHAGKGKHKGGFFPKGKGKGKLPPTIIEQEPVVNIYPDSYLLPYGPLMPDVDSNACLLETCNFAEYEEDATVALDMRRKCLCGYATEYCEAVSGDPALCETLSQRLCRPGDEYSTEFAMGASPFLYCK